MSKGAFVFILAIVALLITTQAQAGAKPGVAGGQNAQTNHHGH